MTCSDVADPTSPPPSGIIFQYFLYVQDGKAPNRHNFVRDLHVEHYHCSLTDADNVGIFETAAVDLCIW